MAKTGEIDYLKNLARERGDYAVLHALGKPFSDANCAAYLTEFAAVLALLPPPPARLLDFGCGTGWTSFFFAKAGYDVTGVDIAPDMIGHAKERLVREGQDHLEFITADYEELDGAGAYDAVVFFDALHHAMDEVAALRCAHRALKPGGLCVASEPGGRHSHSAVAQEAVRKFNVTEKGMPPVKIIAVARRVGFRDFWVYPHAFRIQREVYPLRRQRWTNGTMGPLQWIARLATSPVRMLYRTTRLTAWNAFGRWASGITVLVK